jgi:drug/metabolite transporter (DMT)-like permease
MHSFAGFRYSCLASRRFRDRLQAIRVNEMNQSRNVHLKTHLLLALVVLFGPLGNVLVGKGVKSVGALNSWAPGALFNFFWRAFTTPTIWLGIASLLTFFVAYIVVLSWADYSFVQPATAISYAVVALLSSFLLHEIVKPMQWIGVGIICFGVFIVGNTSPRTTKHD